MEQQVKLVEGKLCIGLQKVATNENGGRRVNLIAMTSLGRAGVA